MPTENRRFLVHGRVQGVFFRQSTRAEAQRLGLTGFARNNPDGTVTIEAQGPTDALDALQAWCHHGPPTARVDRVEVSSAEAQDFVGFVVAR